MKYLPIDSKLFIKNRKKLTELMIPGSLAIFNANDLLPTNADGTMAFKQNNDLFYLCGVDQEDSVLVIFPDAPNEKHREVLFLKETNKEIAIWEGEKLTKETAFTSSGIKTVYWLQDLHKVLRTLVYEAETICLNDNEHLRADKTVETRDDRFRDWCKKEFPLHNYERIAPILHNLRVVKEPEEIQLMQTACNLTAKGVERVLKFIKPGVMEYEIEAELMHEFIKNRSKGFAYSPIIASGFSACVLHYVENNQECKSGDVILMDIGAEYGNYASDLTRSIPVSGKFTARQREVYESVLTVMKKANAILRPGIIMADYHLRVGEFMTEELLKLGLLTQKEVEDQNPEWPAYKEYFMHGTSHYIGLDVHDVGNYYSPIEEGSVFTIEPGIYIREESLGIRLENDFLIGADKNTDLMSHIPLEADDIEAAMKS